MVLINVFIGVSRACSDELGKSQFVLSTDFDDNYHHLVRGWSTHKLGHGNAGTLARCLLSQ